MDSKKAEACKIVVCNIVDLVRDKLMSRFVKGSNESILLVFNELRRNFLSEKCGTAINRFVLGGALFMEAASRCKIKVKIEPIFKVVKEMADKHYRYKKRIKFTKSLLSNYIERLRGIPTKPVGNVIMLPTPDGLQMETKNVQVIDKAGKDITTDAYVNEIQSIIMKDSLTKMFGCIIKYPGDLDQERTELVKKMMEEILSERKMAVFFSSPSKIMVATE